MVKAKLRPGFHLLAFHLKLLNGNKPDLGDDLLVFLHLFRRAKQYMHNTEMNPTDFSGIVVDQTNGSCVKGTLNGEFFAHLSLDSRLKRLQAVGKECVICVIDVATDAN